MTRVEPHETGGPDTRELLEEEYALEEQWRQEEPELALAGENGPAVAGQEEYVEAYRCRRHAGVNVGRLERLASVGAGAAMTAFGLMRGRASGLALAALGGSLLYRGLAGRCYCYAALGIDTSKHKESTAVPAQQGFKVERSITIYRSPDDLYGFWREVENLPQVMRHLRRVERLDRQRSHWVAEGALGMDVQWDAEIINERENEMIAWRSLPGGDVETAGSVHFKRLGHDRGTEVTVSIKYNPPAGKVGAAIAGLFGSGLETKIKDDLRNFKQMMETGEIATVEGQPSGRRWMGGR